MDEVRIEGGNHSGQFTPGSIAYIVMHVVVWLTLLVAIPLFVVPEFREMFEEFEIALPVLSEIVVGWSGRTVKQWFIWVPVIFMISIGSGTAMLLMRKSKLRKALKFANLGLMLSVALLLALAIGIPFVAILNA